MSTEVERMLNLLSKLLLVSLAVSSLTTTTSWSISRNKNTRKSFSLLHAEQQIILDKQSTLVLPIFPLRKNARLPTESFVLNLYEKRYLNLSEFVLSRDRPLFGAMYSSNKPQFVRGGKGPMVPLLEEGDIGVLCFVREWEEALVATRDPTFKRRRIRLNAIGVSRFRIEEIVDDGTASVGSDDASFIIVKARLIVDRKAEETSMAKDDVYRRMQELGVNLNEVVDEILSAVSFSDRTVDEQRSELKSFAAASALCSESTPPSSRQSLLQLGSSNERLLWLLEQQKLPFWKGRSS